MRSKREVIAVSALVAALLFCGCCGLREGAKGVLGVSTKVLVDTKPQAAVKMYAFGFDACMAQVEEELAAMGAFVYGRQDAQHLTAVYVSPTDTTPVGVFVEPVDQGTTRISVSSPSSAARDYISAKLFLALDVKLLENKNVKVQLDRSPSQDD